jgi:hypothetical protein
MNDRLRDAVDCVVFYTLVFALFAIPITYLLGYHEVSEGIAMLAVVMLAFDWWILDGGEDE